MNTRIIHLAFVVLLILSGTDSSFAASFAQATISNVSFVAISLNDAPASYAFLINQSYPYTTPTTVGATVYDYQYTSPGGYDSKYLNTYNAFDNLAVTATAHFNQAYACSNSGFLSAWASSLDQMSATSIAATGSFVSPGQSGLAISANAVLFIHYDITTTASDQGLHISPQRPYESAFAMVSFSFYGETGSSWQASDTVLVSSGTHADATAETHSQNGSYVSWIINSSNETLLTGFDVRTRAEAYGGGIASIPEPGSWEMLVAGIGLLVAMARNKVKGRAYLLSKCVTLMRIPS